MATLLNWFKAKGGLSSGVVEGFNNEAKLTMKKSYGLRTFNGAFTDLGVAGGSVGALIQGFKRAAFSNEAGVGSAAIAHSCSK